MKENSKNKVFRARLNVPIEDTDVLDWLSGQQNASVSIRLLIKQAVALYGPGDLLAIGALVKPEKEQVVVALKLTENAENITENNTDKKNAESVFKNEYKNISENVPVKTGIKSSVMSVMDGMKQDNRLKIAQMMNQ